MTFNINEAVFDRDGMPREKVVEQYKEQLSKLFVESSEGQALLDEDIEPGWSDMVIDFGMDYLGVTPAKMSPDNLREILFDLFPRKVSAEADDAPEVIHELQYFWKFLEREFHLKNATACLNILNDNAANELKKAMSNPANYGMAKSFVMMGRDSGFDMSTEEGVRSWMEIYNAGIAKGTQPRIPLPGEQSKSASNIRDSIKILRSNRDKMAKTS
ncbi:MAG TPA: hypothetical protein VIY29_06345, partial [Ktedonobacteraceae bacterium]